MRARLVLAWTAVACAVAACSTFSSDTSGGNDGGLDAIAQADADVDAIAPGDEVRPDAPPITSDAAVKRVFVTSTTYDGILGQTPTTWDSKCQDRADAAKLGGAWVAWVSGSASNAIDRLRPSTPYVMLNGVFVADGGAQLRSGELAAEIRVTELDADVFGISPFNVWTGTRPDAGVTTDTCNEWTSNDGSGAVQGRYGSQVFKDNRWTSVGSTVCSVHSRLYCFEK